MIQNRHGFTLLEALITGAIAMVVVLGFVALNSNFSRQQKTNQVRMNANDFMKRLESIVNEKAEALVTKKTN
jgi:type II secretory pathway component PulJ